MDHSNGTATACRPVSTTHMVNSRLPSMHVSVSSPFRVGSEADAQVKSATALLDLVLKTTQAESIRTALQLVVNEVRAHLSCDRVAIGLRRGGQGRC